jgi:hypothetical protein
MFQQRGKVVGLADAFASPDAARWAIFSGNSFASEWKLNTVAGPYPHRSGKVKVRHRWVLWRLGPTKTRKREIEATEGVIVGDLVGAIGTDLLTWKFRPLRRAASGG